MLPNHALLGLGLFAALMTTTPRAEALNAPATRPALLDDVTLAESGEALVFANSRLKLTLRRADGALLRLEAAGVATPLLAGPVAAADARVDGRRVLEKTAGVAARHEVGATPGADAVELRIVSRPAGEVELACRYTLYPRRGRVDVAARLVNLRPGAARRLEAFAFSLPRAVVGEAGQCVVNVPGPSYPKTYVRPHAPYASLVRSSVTFHGAPDGGFGLLAITNAVRKQTLAAWMDTRGGEANYHPSIVGADDRLSLQFTNNRAYRLGPGEAAESDVLRVELFDGPVGLALAEYRRMCERTMPPDPLTPGWVREMVLLEAYPAYYPGGFKELTNKLAFYKDVGFNTVYLMPHWLGGYSPLDLYTVDPRYGTADDLKALVRRAHELGMRVLFDMVIHGFNEKSSVPKERPELFVRNEAGSLVRHPTWKSITTDWASEAYRKYMVDYVLHDLRTYGIDGYRVDAASYKGASWDPRLPYPAYRSGSAAPELMKLMLAAMRKEKPDAVLLSEVFGPAFYTACNLVHDNQTEAPQWFLERMEAGEATAEDYKAHLAQVFAMLPAGANRVCFARNHDTSWFYHFNGYTPPFMSLDAIHALVAIPEVFGGDRKHGPHPDAEAATYDYYRRLFALRRSDPAFTRGEVLFDAVSCDQPNVFTALRRHEGKTTLIAVSLGDKAMTVKITATVGRGREELVLRDPISGAEARGTADGEHAATVTVGAFQVLTGRW